MDVFGITYIIENAQQFWSGTLPHTSTCYLQTHRHDLSQNWRKSYSFRMMRRSNSLTQHSYGLSISVRHTMVCQIISISRALKLNQNYLQSNISKLLCSWSTLVLSSYNASCLSSTQNECENFCSKTQKRCVRHKLPHVLSTDELGYLPGLDN